VIEYGTGGLFGDASNIKVSGGMPVGSLKGGSGAGVVSFVIVP
jgi:hypothetical protein